MLTAWRIALKDLRVLSRDRYALLLLMVMPLAIMTIVCFSLDQFVKSTQLDSIGLVVFDQDDTPVSRRLIDSLSTGSVRVRIVESQEAALTLVRQSDWTAALSIERGMGAKLEALDLADILQLPKSRLAGGITEFGISVSSSSLWRYERLVVSQYVYGKFLELVYDQMLERYPLLQAYTTSRSAPPESGASDSFPATAGKAELTREGIYRLVIPSQVVLFTFFLVNIMARSFISERARGTFERLRVASLPRRVIILGKTLPFFLISIVQGVLLFLTGWAIFDLPLGPSPWLLLPIIVSTSLAATGLGLLISVLVGTDYQVNVFATFLILVMAGISGCLMPREFIPPVMRQVSLALTPHAWSLSAYEEVLVATVPDAMQVLLYCAVLVLITVALVLSSNWRLQDLEA